MSEKKAESEHDEAGFSECEGNRGGSLSRPPPRFNFNFKQLPTWLREGPWSPCTYILILAYFGALVYTFRDAMQEFVADDGLQERYSNGAQETMPMKTALVRGGGIVWTLGVIAYMINAIGVWPFISYTLQGWTVRRRRRALQQFRRSRVLRICVRN